MKPRTLLLILTALFIISAGCFLFWGLPVQAMGFILPRRVIKVTALCVTAVSIAISTTLFQTVSANTILTPSILGLDSLYLLIQTLVMFLFGAQTLVIMSRISDFLLSVGLMVLFSLALFSLLLGKRPMAVTTVLFLGMIVGQLFGALSSFFQLLIDPNEFLTIQARMFASFNTINTSLLLVSTLIVAFACLLLIPLVDTLDVLAMGREMAINLGIDHRRLSRWLLIGVSILTAVATALVGPITFLGLLVVSLARQISPTFRHRIILPVSALLAMVTLLIGQFIFERILHFSTPISIIINFVGGIYFLSLLIKRRRI